jgi:protein-tyrosine phosphatase
MNVLFVCTGNVCRSPMAEGFLKREAERLGLRLGVRSTGTHAWSGRAATYEGRRVMAELGTPIDDHRTLELDDRLVDWSDLILCLAAEHERDVLRTFADAAGKTFTLKGFLHLLPSLPAYDEARTWIAAADAAATDVRHLPDTDVDDPYGEREVAYRRVAAEIDDLIRRLAAGLEEKAVTRTG